MHKRQLPKSLKTLIFCFFTGLLINSQASAQTPAYSYAPASVTADTISLASNPVNYAQYLFTPADFSPSLPSGGGTITKIYIKAGNAQASGSTFSNLMVNIGTTASGSLSAAWNLGLTISYPFANTTIGAWTTDEWIPITLSTPFTWNGTSNLIIGLYQAGFTDPMLLQHGIVSGRNVRAYGNGDNVSPDGADSNLVSLGFDLACNGVPDAPAITTAAFSSSAPLCSGSTATISASGTTSPGVGITYQWETSSSATGPWTNVTGGSGAATLSYTTGAITSDTYFRLAATCTYSSSTSYSSAYLVPIGPAQPAAISGPATFCPGDNATYSVPNVAGTTYTWTLPIGWSGTSTTNSIVVTPGANAGTISVSADPACLGSTAPTLALTPGNPPSTPGTVFGNSVICSGTTQTYTTLPVAGANSYIWTLPSGWTGTSTTNSITVTVSNNSGNVTVRTVNGCGQSSNATPLMVTVFNTLPNPGTIAGNDTVCSGTLQGYSVTPIPGATSYTWTLPSGWSGTTTGPSIQAFAGSAGGTISVTASAACATSPASSRTLTVRPTVVPAVALSAPSAAVCEHAPVTFTATPVNGGTSPAYQWRKNGVTVAGTASSYTDNTLTSSDFISVTMTSNAVCAAGTIVTSNSVSANVIPSVIPGVSINTTPPITICKGSPVTFTTTSNGAGSAPDYQWFKNGVIIPGATGTTYTDAGLSHGDTVTVQMTTSEQCPAIPTAASNKVGVSVSDSLTATVSVAVSPSDIILAGQELIFTATESNGGSTPTYQWQKNGANIPFETSNTYRSNTLQAGDHISVMMYSYAACVRKPLVSSNTIILKKASPVVGIDNSKIAEAGISVYPNPTSGRFSIVAKGWERSGKPVRVDVISALGQVAYRLELTPTVANNSWQTQISLDQQLANGRYMLQIGTTDGSFRATLPLVLNR
jgi:hypothetical protein